MKLYKLSISLFLLLNINVISFVFGNDTADLFIAIYFNDEAFNPIKKQIIQIQNDIVNTASAIGYKFIPFVQENELHITLDRIQDANVKDIPKYEECIKKAIADVGIFDISQHFKKAYFNILGDKRKWGILQFNISRQRCGSTKLARRIRYCLKQSKLLTGIYDVYKPHISLGVFSDKTAVIPSNLDWVPEIEIVIEDKPLIVNKVSLDIRKYIKNKQTGVISEVKSSKIFKLKQSDKNKHIQVIQQINQCEKNKNTKSNENNQSAWGCVIM